MRATPSGFRFSRHASCRRRISGPQPLSCLARCPAPEDARIVNGWRRVGGHRYRGEWVLDSSSFAINGAVSCRVRGALPRLSNSGEQRRVTQNRVRELTKPDVSANVVEGTSPYRLFKAVQAACHHPDVRRGFGTDRIPDDHNDAQPGGERLARRTWVMLREMHHCSASAPATFLGGFVTWGWANGRSAMRADLRPAAEGVRVRIPGKAGRMPRTDGCRDLV